MEFNYLYIDDAPKHIMNGTVAGLKESDYLNIICENPVGNWEEQRQNILDRQSSLDGLILDLRLEDYKNEQNKISYFKGSTLAQELRTLSKENSFEEIPIILLSATANITTSFDSTGFDLFDLIIHKDKLNVNEYPVRKRQLYSLANGYKKLKSFNEQGISEILEKVFGPEISMADIRFQQKFYNLFAKTSHELVRFILRELIERDGILICEETLAARLGIDYKNSKGWDKLLENLGSYTYKGIFSDGWKLWWSFGINDWWSQILDESSDPRYLNSEQRVSILKDKTKIVELENIPRGSYSQSTMFWNICSKTRVPLDPIDSVLAAGQDNLFPWQDRLYISIEQALHGQKNDLSPLEWERVDKLKKIYSRERIRREQK